MRLTAACAFLALVLPSAAQTTWFVDASATGPGTGTASDPYQSLQFGIDATTTVTGDTLNIAAGTYLETINTRGKDLILDGSQAASKPVIDAQGTGSVLTINSGETFNCLIKGVVLTGGVGTPVPGGTTRGGGAYILNSQVSFEAVDFRGNEAFQGGGVAAVASITLYQDCAVEDNRAEAGGGIYSVSSDVIYAGGRVSNNRAEGLSAQGYGGGALLDSLSTSSFDDVTFSGNRALYSGGGGAICTTMFALSTTFNQCRFEQNEPGLFNGPGSGGAILSQGGSIYCTDSHFEGNGQITEEGTSEGGAVSGGEYIDCTFVGNAAQQGGAMFNASATRCVFQDNSACAGSGGRGGATYGSALIDCDLIGNYVCGRGGGAYGGTLEGCRVMDNFAYFDEAFSMSEGGGLHSSTAIDCVIERNHCAQELPSAELSEGGGAHSSVLDRCTVLSNRASVGGGVFGGSAVQATISGNFGSVRSGAAEGGMFDSCILWHNFPADATATGTFVYSNVESGVAGGLGNLSSNPLFFGTSAADVHLQAGSPSIDTGSLQLPLDMDGTRADMGALPFDPSWVTGPSTYCQATPTFFGCTVELEAAGAASLGNGIALRATGAPPAAFGLFFMGTQPNYELVPGSTALRPNTLCVGGAVRRTAPVQSTTATGNCGAEFQKLVTPQEFAATGAQVGSVLFGQFWFRQPAGASGQTGTAMSNAIALPIVP